MAPRLDHESLLADAEWLAGPLRSYASLALIIMSANWRIIPCTGQRCGSLPLTASYGPFMVNGYSVFWLGT